MPILEAFLVKILFYTFVIALIIMILKVMEPNIKYIDLFFNTGKIITG